MALTIGNQRIRLTHCYSVLFFLILFSGICGACYAEDVTDTTVKITKLITLLGHEKSGYQAATILGQMKESAIPRLIPALSSPNAHTRKWSARSLTNMVGGYGETTGRPSTVAAGPALVAATAAEQDESVLWYQLQAIGSVQPPPELALPVLQRLLTHPNDTVRKQAIEACGDYGAAAQSTLETLISQLAAGGDTARDAVTAIFRIDPGQNTLECLLQLDLPEAVIAQTTLVTQLLRSPVLATTYLPRYPQALGSLYPDSFISLFQAQDPEHRTLRAHLVTRSDLPDLWIALLEDRSLVDTLHQRQKKADKHRKTYLAACLRAMGEPLGRVIEIESNKPGDFKPTSAWPATDSTRMESGGNSGGHGDSFASVLVTGTLRRSDGSIPREVRFFNTNDRMLLDQKLRDKAPIVYHPDTGRFIFPTTVFAAYSMGADAPEPGPYQTGAAQTLIVADHAVPLTVNFYDEMPDVRITLTPGEAHADPEPTPPDNPLSAPQPSMP